MEEHKAEQKSESKRLDLEASQLEEYLELKEQVGTRNAEQEEKLQQLSMEQQAKKVAVMQSCRAPTCCRTTSARWKTPSKTSESARSS